MREVVSFSFPHRIDEHNMFHDLLAPHGKQ
jgi:hypothetical protein